MLNYQRVTGFDQEHWGFHGVSWGCNASHGGTSNYGWGTVVRFPSSFGVQQRPRDWNLTVAAVENNHQAIFLVKLMSGTTYSNNLQHRWHSLLANPPELDRTFSHLLEISIKFGDFPMGFPIFFHIFPMFFPFLGELPDPHWMTPGAPASPTWPRGLLPNAIRFPLQLQQLFGRRRPGAWLWLMASITIYRFYVYIYITIYIYSFSYIYI